MNTPVIRDTQYGWDSVDPCAMAAYPPQYFKAGTLKNGTMVTIRPVRPEDEPLIVNFHESLSENSIYFRWLTPLPLSQRLEYERLSRLNTANHGRELELVADYHDPVTAQHQILGVGSLIKLCGTNEGTLALLVGDRFQRLGLGTELINQLLKIGQDEKLTRLTGEIHPENRAMYQICRKFGLNVHYSIDEQLLKFEVAF